MPFVPVICATSDTCSFRFPTSAISHHTQIRPGSSPEQSSSGRSTVQRSVTGSRCRCRRRSCCLYFEPIPSHTILVLAHQTLTIFLRIVGPAEQHTLVARGFLVFADTARLENPTKRRVLARSFRSIQLPCWMRIYAVKGAQRCTKVRTLTFSPPAAGFTFDARLLRVEGCVTIFQQRHS
jgi:hypothetical protein